MAVRTPWGRVLSAIREDEDAAASLGRNVFGYKLQALAVGSAFAGLAGRFFAWQFSFFSPTTSRRCLTFFAWMIVILGGSARFWSVPVGAVVFGVIFAGTRFFDFVPFSLVRVRRARLPAPDRDRPAIIGLVVFRPQGILGRARSWCWSDRFSRCAAYAPLRRHPRVEDASSTSRRVRSRR